MQFNVENSVTPVAFKFRVQRIIIKQTAIRPSRPVIGIVLPLGAGIARSVQRLATGWTTEGSEFESR
jgi:hypothetical protein